MLSTEFNYDDKINSSSYFYSDSKLYKEGKRSLKAALEAAETDVHAGWRGVGNVW